MDLGELLINMGMDTGTSAGQFDFAGGVLSDGYLSPASLLNDPPRKAVRLKGTLGRGYQQTHGEQEINSHGVFRYATRADSNGQQSLIKAGLQKALHISPHGGSIDASNRRS